MPPWSAPTDTEESSLIGCDLKSSRSNNRLDVCLAHFSPDRYCGQFVSLSCVFQRLCLSSGSNSSANRNRFPVFPAFQNQLGNKARRNLLAHTCMLLEVNNLLVHAAVLKQLGQFSAEREPLCVLMRITFMCKCVCSSKLQPRAWLSPTHAAPAECYCLSLAPEQQGGHAGWLRREQTSQEVCLALNTSEGGGVNLHLF